MNRNLPIAHRAVTLLEVILAMGLLVVLSTMTYWFYESGLAASRQGTSEADKLRLARVVMDRITTEIRQANSVTADDRVGIRGDKEHLWISTLRVPTKETTKLRSSRDPLPPPETDLVKIEYKIA